MRRLTDAVFVGPFSFRYDLKEEAIYISLENEPVGIIDYVHETLWYKFVDALGNHG